MATGTKNLNKYKPYVYKRAEDLGIPVQDSKEHMRVVVTMADVVLAKKADSKHCALARATMRLPRVNAAYFFRSLAFIEYPDAMVKYQLPISVQKEIVSFDRAGVFAEGTYQLAPISPQKTVARRAKYEQKRKKARRAAASKAAAVRSKANKSSGTMTEREQSNFLAAQKAGLGPDGFAKKVADVLASHIGERTVTGIRRADAPAPLPSRAPTRYVHRTQYVRDLREPQD